MGFFKNIFGGENPKGERNTKTVPWIALTSMQQLDEIVQNSKEKPQIVFKHSTTCGISRMVLNMFTQDFSLAENQMDLYFLDLHSYRAISNEVADKFQVRHQSPQLLVIKNGTLVAHNSHGAITEVNLNNYV